MRIGESMIGKWPATLSSGLEIASLPNVAESERFDLRDLVPIVKKRQMGDFHGLTRS
jgi:hypothetical protein